MKLKYKIDFIQDKNKKTIIKKAISILERAFYSGEEKASFFLDPYEQDIIKSIADQNEIFVNFIGGNSNSERKIFVANSYVEHDTSDFFKVMEFKSKNIKHKDVLGALIHLGINRENIGDIVLKNEKVEFVILDKDSSFVKYNLFKIKNEKVNIEFKKNNILSESSIDYESKTGFVSFLRLDTIISELIMISRSKAKEMIKSRNIKVNYVNVIDPSKIIEEGSIISIKKNGRFVFDKIQGISKKGNFKINYRKYK